ncbi:MAG TPA: isoprenylcysteine carboxylmethyltransferase family protein [Acidobacteriota bacterium]|nr:isoprenylcysteine carboxylmethyltransferase family protein [Acidobacteriota bacterium]
MLAVRSLMWTVIAPGTVTLLIPYLIVTRWSPASIGSWGTLQFFALTVITLGAAVLFHCIWNFAARGRGTLSPLDAPRRLVVEGLYRRMRNPMYVGVLTILLGEAVLFQSLVLVGYALCWFGLVNLVIVFYEEPALRRKFGRSYQHYCRHVGRWFPGRRYSGDEKDGEGYQAG